MSNNVYALPKKYDRNDTAEFTTAYSEAVNALDKEDRPETVFILEVYKDEDGNPKLASHSGGKNIRLAELVGYFDMWQFDTMMTTVTHEETAH